MAPRGRGAPLAASRSVITPPTGASPRPDAREAPISGSDAVHVERFEGSHAAWDGFVRGSEGSSYAHWFGWNAVIRRVFGHETYFLVARSGAGHLTGILPLVRVTSRVFGRYLVSMPFVNYGGPLGPPAAVRALVDHAVGLADAERVGLLELRCRASQDIDLPVSHRKVTVVLDLPPADPDALWSGLSSKVRSQIRRPRKAGIDVQFGRDQLGGFVDVYRHHMRDLGTPALPPRFFEGIADEFGENVWFGCACYDGRPVAAGCGFRWGHEFEMTWASALRRHSRLAPNMLLYWSFMKRAVEEGLTMFNFGRCTPGGGTHRFKRQWGTRDEPLWWYQHRRGALTATPSPDRGGYALGVRVWRRLPLPIANVLGPRIVRYIP